MSILKIARIGTPVLRGVARPVPEEKVLSPEIQRLIDDMIATMREYEGVGVAAPQVQVPLRLAVLEVPATDSRSPNVVPLTVLVNPRVTPLGDETIDGWEGCLSVPELRGQVPRFKRVRLEALDREGRAIVTEAEGFHARVIQHECDHLDGRVYLDRMRDMSSLAFLHELERYVLQEHDEDE